MVGFKSNPFSVELVTCRSFDHDLSSCMDIHPFHCGLTVQFSAVDHVPFVGVVVVGVSFQRDYGCGVLLSESDVVMIDTVLPVEIDCEVCSEGIDLEILHSMIA